MSSYKDLIVWKKALNVVSDIYRLTSSFPKEEMYGLTSQMRRSALSIPSNIAEGAARKQRKEYHYFVRVAYGSCAELETQIEISKRLGFLSIEKMQEIEDVLQEVMRMLHKVKLSLQ